MPPRAVSASDNQADDNGPSEGSNMSGDGTAGTYYKVQNIRDGYGETHINRFRICARPITESQRITIGRNIAVNLPQYMDPASASVKLGDYKWANDRQTLKFRGITRIRPFSVPITGPIMGPVSMQVPASIRDWMMPDAHTDSVGVIHQDNCSCVVQTLKREYQDGDDAIIRAAALGLTIVPPNPILIAAGQVLASIPIDINQHHFLAGRRAWRFDLGSVFGYSDDRVVMETAAIERYSLPVFEKSSEMLMGPIEPTVQKIWSGMVERFCQVHSLQPIPGEPPSPGWTKYNAVVQYVQQRVPFVDAARSYTFYPEMNKLHKYILDPDDPSSLVR